MKYSSLMQLKQQTTPTEFTHQLQRMGDIFWWPAGNFWVITSYQLAKTVLMSDDYTCDRSSFFISRMPDMDLSLITDFFSVVSKMMVMSDAPQHTARRRICYHGLDQAYLNQLQALIEHTTRQCLQGFSAGKSFEFVTQLAQIIPSTTLAELFAIPPQDREKFYLWSNEMTQFFGGSSRYQNEDGIKVNHSAQQLHDYFAYLIKQRRHQLGSDFFSILLSHQAAFGLTDEEIISQGVMMLVAGQVTTTDQLSNNLFTLLSTPRVWQTLQHDSSQIDAYIEEANRLDPAVTFIFRVTKTDTQLNGQSIKKGDVIFISTHAVNRDPGYFSEPDSIAPQANTAKHFSYGYGSHFCLGAKLARIEMHIILRQLLQQFKELSIANDFEPIRKHHSLSFSGFEQLYLLGESAP